MNRISDEGKRDKMKEEEPRQRNFFDVCNRCQTSYSCCNGTTPPVTDERRRIIESYLKAEGIRVDSPFVEAEYVYPRLKIDGYCVFHDEKSRKCLVHQVKPETCVAGPVTFDINARTRKIEWFVKMESLCKLAKFVYDDKQLLEKHIASAKKELLRLVDQLDPCALKAILRKDEPETFKIAEDSLTQSILDKLA